MKNNNEIEGKILSALDEIRPYLQTDGGDISFVNINNENEVRIKLLGACGTCAMSIQTLKLGVERTIQRVLPQVTRVIAVDENLQDIIDEL
jgi:Fe-S cluster biogenesis protein NfuA